MGRAIAFELGPALVSSLNDFPRLLEATLLSSLVTFLASFPKPFQVITIAVFLYLPSPLSQKMDEESVLILRSL